MAQPAASKHTHTKKNATSDRGVFFFVDVSIR